MSSLAAKFLAALALVACSARAAVTCAKCQGDLCEDYTAITGADNNYCMMGAASCQTSPTCCTAPTPTKTCLTEAGTITCDTGKYNRMTLSGVGSDAAANKAQCCMNKATCATAACSAWMEKDTTKSTDAECPRDAASCDTSCCKAKAGTCYAWTTGNQCDSGSSILAAHWTKTGADKAACCTADVKCSTHTCPSATHELKANAANLKCDQGACDNTQCCQCKSTTCCGTTVACGANMYKDSAKDGVTFTDKADCCTTQAQCKDGATAVSGAPVLSSFWPMFSALSMLGLLLSN